MRPFLLVALAAAAVACRPEPRSSAVDADLAASESAAVYASVSADTGTFRDTAPYGYIRYPVDAHWAAISVANGVPHAWAPSTVRHVDSATVAWWERYTRTERPGYAQYIEQRLDCATQSVRDGANFTVIHRASGQVSVDSSPALQRDQLIGNGRPVFTDRDSTALRHCADPLR